METNNHSAVMRLRGVDISFSGVSAITQLDLDLYSGEVHVLLGENGAGKSTLVNLLSGRQQPDSGEMIFDGQPKRLRSPGAAISLGVGTIFQHGMLIPTLTVLENLRLGDAWWKCFRRLVPNSDVLNICRETGARFPLDIPVAQLSLGEQQQAEIVRCLLRKCRVIILDEPTSMLTPKSIQKLGQLMKRLAGQGIAVLFITHKLHEALRWGDRITILCRGRKTGEITPERLGRLTQEETLSKIVKCMFGRATTYPGLAMSSRIRYADRSGPPILEVKELEALGAVKIKDISLRIWPGEIVGIAGIDGNGQKQLAETLAGLQKSVRGDILLDGESIQNFTVRQRRKCGLRYVTDNRMNEGVAGDFSISINLLLKQIGDTPFWDYGIENHSSIIRYGRTCMNEYDIRAMQPDTIVSTLSGGNIQKVILARELIGKARTIIFSKPTYGLDLKNIVAIHQRICDAAKNGMAILLISTDIDEILALADRIAVMSRGRILQVINNSEQAQQQVAELMSEARNDE